MTAPGEGILKYWAMWKKLRYRHVYMAALVLALCAAAIWARAFTLQKEHFANAEGYHARADWKLAMREYDLAMHMYTPWSPYVERSAQRLWEIGGMFEREGKPDWALIAYGSIRSSFYASRSFYTPGKGWIDRCDGKIAGLNVGIMLEDGMINGEDVPVERENFLHVLRYDDAPDACWSLAALAGFAAWMISVVFIIFAGFGDTGRVRWRHVLWGAAAFIVSFAIWALALLKA